MDTMIGFTIQTGLFLELDNKMDFILPFIIIASLVFVSMNLLLTSRNATPPKC